MQALGLVRISKNTKSTVLKTEGALVGHEPNIQYYMRYLDQIDQSL